jgi:hypothetical protein
MRTKGILRAAKYGPKIFPLILRDEKTDIPVSSNPLDNIEAYSLLIVKDSPNKSPLKIAIGM